MSAPRWLGMRAEEFTTGQGTLFDIPAPQAPLEAPGSLFEPIPCHLCGSTDSNRLTLGTVALCADRDECADRRDARDGEL